MAYNGNNNRGKSNNYRKERKKPEVRTLQCTFDTFADMVDNIRQMPGFLSNELDDLTSIMKYEEGEERGISAFNELLINIFLNNIPDAERGENRFWSLSMSLDRCFLKTAKYLAFGYFINKETDDDGKQYIVSVTATYISYNAERAEAEINYLLDTGWEVVGNKKNN